MMVEALSISNGIFFIAVIWLSIYGFKTKKKYTKSNAQLTYFKNDFGLKEFYSEIEKELSSRLPKYAAIPDKKERQEAQRKDELVWVLDSYALMLKKWRKKAGVW